MNEAEYLDTIYPYTEEYAQEMRCTAIVMMSKQYDKNSEAKIGSTIECPYCQKKFIKKSYQHKFCNTKCKDKYWNIINPRGIYGK